MRRKTLLRLACVLLTALLTLSSQVSAFAAERSAADTEKLATLAGKTAGVMTGTPQDSIVKENVDGAEILYFNSLTDLVLALRAGKVDFLCLSSVNYYTLAEEYPDLAYLDVALRTYDVGSIFPMNSDGEALKAKFDQYIAKIEANGELARLQEYWLKPNSWENVDIPTTGENGVLHMATSNTMKPFSMDLNGKDAGFDIAIAAGFCKEYGYGLEISNVDFAGTLTGIAAGTYDFAAGQISWTEERAQSVLFSSFYYTQQMVPIVRAGDYAAGEVVRASGSSDSEDADGTPAAQAEGKTLWTSIRRTLLDQERWKSVLKGLGTTLVITFAGFALANALGALLCAMSLSQSRALRVVSRLYAGFMQGLPNVVILMVLYYVVLASARLNGVAVASLGFGMIFAANMAQLFEGAIRGVEVGQWEAALSSGLTKRQAFRGIILPQAARASLTAYFANLISLMKGTAVVGYIAVSDLTQVGDIIRSSTYEAFVPILTVAAIYLVITCLILLVMTLVKRAITAPRGGHNGKAGVRA